MHLSVYPAHPLSLHHIYPVPPFSFMHMMHILNAASFSQSSYWCVTPPCSANSRGGVCKYIICINQKHYTHTYTHTLLIAPLESYFSHIHNQALWNGMRMLQNRITSPIHHRYIPESPPTDHSSHITLRVGRAAVFASVNIKDWYVCLCVCLHL